MTKESAGPTFEVHVDEEELAEDLAHATEAARGAGKAKLFLLAVGERHPRRPWRLSVYEVAHRRLHQGEGDGAEQAGGEGNDG